MSKEKQTEEMAKIFCGMKMKGVVTAESAIKAVRNDSYKKKYAC